MSDPLSPLQRRVLAILAPVRPQWTLTGGAALAGWHLQHRTTRDLDLFWHGLRAFTREPEDCQQHLRDAGLAVEVLQRAPGFARMRVADAAEAVLVDLVAEPVAQSQPPQSVATPGGQILVDAPQEILANKLGALLHRAELRDLVDIRALLASGLDLERGLHDAAAKDLGFSALMIGHLLHSFPVERLGGALGWSAAETAAMAEFAIQLAADIGARAKDG